jgi:hypothetical protein
MVSLLAKVVAGVLPATSTTNELVYPALTRSSHEPVSSPLGGVVRTDNALCP